MKRAAGLIYGRQLQHLDHIATLCQWFNIPLIVTEPDEEAMAKRYYPDLVIFQRDVLSVQHAIVKNFDIIFSSIPVDLFEEIFHIAERLEGKKLLSVWVPHGNSDKGYLSPFMQALHRERLALVYGPKMTDFLKEMDVYHKIQHIVEMGNYRLENYRHRKPFYQAILAEEISPHLDSHKSTILYAPTWQDSENSGSLFHAGPVIIDRLKEEHNLIIKIHPNTSLMSPADLENLKGRYSDSPHVFFLEDFPLVYPLLDLADIYIGDMSSIGYDFLAFDKPMLFLNHTHRDQERDKGLTLHQCGFSLKSDEFDTIDDWVKRDQSHLSQKRRDLYHYTFATISLAEQKKKILSLCHEIVDDLFLI